MHDWQSLSHVRWECKYHVAIIAKYRRIREQEELERGHDEFNLE